jgi:hypothetical protein
MAILVFFKTMALFTEVPVLSQESEQSCICVRDIEFAYFYDFSIEFLKLFRQCDILFSFYYRL